MSKNIGFIGLGNIGAPMAENLRKKAGGILVYNRSQEKCAPFAERGAAVAASVAEVAEKSELIFLSLPGPAQADGVVRTLLAHGKARQIIVDTSTVSPKLNRDLAAAAAEKGITYLDMPVSGGPAGAANGKLSLMVGAGEEEFLSLGLKEYTDTIGNKYFFMKTRGGGNAIKLINNFMAFAAQAVNGEAAAMADALGISMDDFYEVTMNSSGNNMILGAKMQKVKSGDLKPGFATDLVVKDLELARQLCQDAAIPNFTLNTALQLYRLAQTKGHGKDDSSSVIATIREAYGR
ncbi:MAG: NAD(P)-dependent oxidoreductase [Oscillospiraceae bacterium]|nr:NAD(P)-dependent oxidoreductase [Oscillospiraceae bacterium]